MRTTVDLPIELLDELQRITSAPTKREALIIAMEDYLRRQRLKRIAASAGTVDIDLDVGELRNAGRRRLERQEP